MNIKTLSNLLILCIILLVFIAPMDIGNAIFYANNSILKSAFGVITSSFILLAWMIYAINNKGVVIYQSKMYPPVILFLSWCVLTVLWSDNYYLSVITLAKYLSVGLIFFLILNIFTSTDKVKKLLNALIVSLFFVSVIGLTQYYYVDNNLIQSFFQQSATPGATFVNKNMASHFVVMTLPLSVIFLLISKNFHKLFLYSFVTFLGFWFLIVLSARQAYLAMFIEVLILLLFLALDYYKNNNIFIRSVKIKKWKLLAVISITALLFVASNLERDGGINFESGSKIQKLQRINLQDGIVRIPAWLNTLEMIKDHPIAGVGIGQWSENYPYYYDKASKDIIFNDNNRIVKLHNDYLEILANLGVVGFSLLIWILVITMQQIWVNLKNISMNDYTRELTLALMLGLIGFSIVAFFSFPIRSYVPIFLVMVFIALLGVISRREPILKIYFKSDKVKIYLTLGAALILVSSIYYGIRWVAAEHYYQKSLASLNNKEIPLAIKYQRKALLYNKYPQKYNSRIALQLLEVNKAKEAIPFLLEVVNRSLFDTIALLNLQLAYGRIGDISNQKIVLRRILKGDSKNVKATATLVRILFIEENYAEANSLYKKLKVNFEYFKNRSGFGPYHKILTKLALRVQDYKYASYIYSDLVKRSPTAQRYAVYAVIEYQSLGNKAKAKELFEQALKLDLDVEIPQEIRDDLKL